MRDAGCDVLHLSTALAPVHREAIIRRVQERLNDVNDKDWTLVATSCVEAGVDLSFRSAFRELASTSSMVQVGGRVNRHGENSAQESVVRVAQFDDPRVTRNPGMKIPGKVLSDLFATGLVERLPASELCTEALTRELNEASQGDLKEIKAAEAAKNFPAIAEKYRVIGDETVTVLVDPVLARFENGEQLSPNELERGSVRIRRKALDKTGARQLVDSRELYAWTLGYDPDFLGYMSGVLKADAALRGEFLEA